MLRVVILPPAHEVYPRDETRLLFDPLVLLNIPLYVLEDDFAFGIIYT